MTEPDGQDASVPADHEIRTLVRRSTMPLILLSLPDARILEVSDALASFVESDRDHLLQQRFTDVIADPEALLASFNLLSAGTIDGYTRRGHYRTHEGVDRPYEVRVSAYADESPRHGALGLVMPLGEDHSGDALGASAFDDQAFIVGTVDGDWRIDRITSDVDESVGACLPAMVGSPILDAVHPDDAPLLMRLVAYSHERHGGATGRVRFRSVDGSWILCRIAVLPLAGEGLSGLAFAFSLSRAPSRTDLSQALPAGERARELEEHLRRIAREVTASGVAAWSAEMPTALEVPELGALTPREYEIVVRLGAGARIPTIARALFVSESTVRNHLTSVYRKFGVGSQTELLEKLHRTA